MPKEPFQLPHVYFRKDIEPAVGHKAAVGDKAVEIRVKVDEVPEGLNRDHNPRHAWNAACGWRRSATRYGL